MNLRNLYLVILLLSPSFLFAQEEPESYEQSYGASGGGCAASDDDALERFAYPPFTDFDTSEFDSSPLEMETCDIKTDLDAEGEPGGYQTTRSCDEQEVTVLCCDSLGKPGEGYAGSVTGWISPFGNPYSERCEVKVSSDVCSSLGIDGQLIKTQGEWGTYFDKDRDWGKKFKGLTTLMHEIKGHCLDLCQNYPTNINMSEGFSYCISSTYCRRKMTSVGCEKILKDKKPPDKYRLCLELQKWQMFNHIFSKYNLCLSRMGEISTQDCKKCLEECKREFPSNIEDCNSAYQGHCPPGVR